MTTARRTDFSSAIVLSDVRKTFGPVTALRDLTLEVRSGELTALLGPNGAGKTTAISLMLGLGAPTAGQVQVLGGDPRGGAVRSRIGSMPQESAIPLALTVREAVTLFARFYPAPLAVDQALGLADLGGVAGRRAGALSGGQKRRLAFALAVVGNPEVLLIDEPTTGMDAQSRLAFWDAVTELRTAGRTILLTTHYLEEAERAADRVIVMNAGAVLADGTPEALRSQAGGARVRFTSDLVLAQLQSLPGVEAAEVDDRGHATLRTSAPEALLGALFAQGTPLSELEVSRASLEDAFLNLTRAPA
ncbi:ABC transporter ATP-binding protein [Deinococcus seoulensis]|uniref:ABC transporter ATP-binding protein n=1 Tax=Deinococcus seoulensis TaxID=1837379 RepID=A0ABQ2RQY6_9DEIO|nr:ABC transporter ATP-binding protein [Deinococcus seoulensis]GGR58823.1 ABC transporter ATP-binding protein [Deinococcus seoulensis]